MDNINKPNYYVAKLRNGSEVECWDLICALGLGPALANVLKYVYRAGKKDGQSYVKDLQKARKYIDLELARISDCPIQRGFSASSRPHTQKKETTGEPISFEPPSRYVRFEPEVDSDGKLVSVSAISSDSPYPYISKQDDDKQKHLKNKFEIMDRAGV